MLTSEAFRGTCTLRELREEWSIVDLLDALDWLTYRSALQHANAPRGKLGGQ